MSTLCQEIAKVRGWRPLKDVGPGSLVGVRPLAAGQRAQTFAMS